MTEEKTEEKGGNKVSSTRYRLKKKSKPRKFKTKQETPSTTSSSLEPYSATSSSLAVLHRCDDQIVTTSVEKRKSRSTSATAYHDVNLSSKPSLVNALALQHALAITNSNDEDKNPDDINATSNDDVDAINTGDTWEKEITSKSNHSKSGRRGGRRSRPRTLSRGSNSIRSIGSQNISRSSHCSISAHTMASSLDSGTDSDLDSRYCYDDSYNELLSNIGSDDSYHQDQSFKDHQPYQAESDSSNDDDISEHDSIWREKSQYYKLRASKKLGASPSLSCLHRYSTATEELHSNTAGQSESTAFITTAASSSTLAGETSTKLLLPTPDSSVKELRFSSLPQQQGQTNRSKQGILLLGTSSRENRDAKDNNIHTRSILKNSIQISINNPSKIENHNDHLVPKREEHRNSEDEEFGRLGNQSSILELKPSPIKRQVLWANQLSEQDSHNSKEDVRNEKIQDYEIPLDKIPNTPGENSNTDVFFEISGNGIENAVTNSKHARRSSLSSESLDTLNSSNRQDSVSDVFETESSEISEIIRNSTSHRSYNSQSSSNLADSDRDSRIVELTSRSLSNFQDSQTDTSGVSVSDLTKIAVQSSLYTRSHSQSSSNLVDSDRDSRIVEPTSRSSSNFQDSQTDKIGVSVSNLKKIALQSSLYTRSSSRKERNQKLINHRNNHLFSIERGGKQYSFSETEKDLSEDFYDSFFAPCEECKSAESHGDIDLPIIHQKSSKRHDVEEGAMNPSDDSNCLMEYSISHCPSDNASTLSHKLEKSSLSSSVRMRRHVVRGICAFLILLSGGLIFYFIVRFENNNGEGNPTHIDPFFPVDP